MERAARNAPQAWRIFLSERVPGSPSGRATIIARILETSKMPLL